MTRFARSMFRVPSHVTPPSSLNAGHRRLAARVIHLALRDLEQPGTSTEHRRSAWTFLTGSSRLEYWCELAQTDAAHIVARARASRRRPENDDTSAVPTL